MATIRAYDVAIAGLRQPSVCGPAQKNMAARVMQIVSLIMVASLEIVETVLPSFPSVHTNAKKAVQKASVKKAPPSVVSFG